MTAAPLEIGAVARELGVAPSTLRSWERRYRTVIPRRGEHGQRLYDSDQIVVLRKILAQTRVGVRAHAAHQAAIAEEPVRTSRLRLEPTPEAPQIARQEIRRLLDAGSYGERLSFDARLVTSELVKNAVVHGAPHERIDVEIVAHPDWVELRVGNGGGRLKIRSLRRKPLAGRGFDIVDALADSWAIDAGPRGTRVTVRLATRGGADV